MAELDLTENPVPINNQPYNLSMMYMHSIVEILLYKNLHVNDLYLRRNIFSCSLPL